MMIFLLGVLCGIGMTVGLYLFLEKMSGLEPWEDPLLPSQGPPREEK
jgi:hypothetical protein